LGATLAACGAGLLLCACAPEKRDIAASQPSSPPTAPDDPRAPYYERNAYQVSQGGRLFGWYGCKACHARGAEGGLDLADGRWRRGGRTGEVYGSIAAGPAHGYAGRITDEQLWQLTAYVRRMKDLSPAQERRQAADTVAEPQAAQWTGPRP
jgi:cytochrome c oxidase cbb3-type subunit 3